MKNQHNLELLELLEEPVEANVYVSPNVELK